MEKVVKNVVFLRKMVMHLQQSNNYTYGIWYYTFWQISSRGLKNLFDLEKLDNTFKNARSGKNLFKNTFQKIRGEK